MQGSESFTATLTAQTAMDKEWHDRGDAIQEALTQLRDSL